ncbi:MAG: DUF1320 family protein [Verrucomicrobiales bacterium]|nr:DUF1320 family protein [Verrucomicrobiales bacterium]
MNWITITETAVQTRLTGAELNAFRTAAMAVGQGDPLPEVIAQVTDQVRGYVAACPNNALGATGTIPKRLLASALDIIRYRVATRLPQMAGLIDALREGEYKDALTLLRAVAACNYAIEDPAADGDDTGGGTVEVVNRPPRVAAKSQLGGLA